MARPQPKWISFEIDGRQVRAPEGTMLVDAAKYGDVEIPYFCYEPKLGQPVGACRMCLVEIEGIPKLQTSCSTPVRDGMVVVTTSDRVKHAQNAIVEFLLVNHPLDCPVCDKGGECPLQDISFGWGAGRSRFIEPKRHFKKPLELSPMVAIDRERCILCYRCVRFSQEVAEDHQLVFLERADHTFVGTHDGRPYVAPFSGNIIELCPVGALTSTAYRFRARPWDIEGAGTICTMCPAQCNVELTLRDDAKVMRVLARDNVEVDDGWLCDKGRFGYQSFGSPERLTAPLVRDGGFLREVSWERALSEAVRVLERSGERAAALVGGGATNEEGFLLQRLMRDGLGSPHLDSRAAGRLPGPYARGLARGDLSAKVSDIDHAGAILVLDTELVDEAPILDLRVRKAVRRNHARLVVASARPSTLDPTASATLRFAPGAAEAALVALAAALGSPRAAGPVEYLAGSARTTEDAVRGAADVLRDAGDVVVIWGERVLGGERAPNAAEALLAVASALGVTDKPESGLIEVPEVTNGRGLREMGCVPTLAPGLRDAPAEGLTTAEIADSDELGALLLMEHPLPAERLAAASAVVAFARFTSEALDDHADVVFPAEIYPEKEGTITHPDGRLQRLRQALGHAGEVRPAWRVLHDLCERLGVGFEARTAPMVTARVAEEVPIYAGVTLEEIGGLGVRWQERDAASALPAEELSSEQLAVPPAAERGLHVAVVPTLWSGPEVEHSPSLRFLSTRARVEMSVEDAREAGVQDGDEVTLSVDDAQVNGIAAVRSMVPAGSVFVSGLRVRPGRVQISPARQPVATG
ncbi:MAG TPA: NADH-quinone oxidoreductase subunit NuoG [Thermoleophilaceae bacterium]|nr:NADH-quinone oxidoreductase subunit NuoG [Thermoleophilaceae bacterium]